MFGYVVINKKELKFREYDEYKAAYCGLCRELRERYGIAGEITLNYDMTFVILLLEGLYEPRIQKGTSRCALHPLKKQEVTKSEITEYAADMNMILSYYKCIDDWEDEKAIGKLIYSGFLKKGNRRAAKSRIEKTKKIVSLLQQMSEAEKRGEKNPDYMAGLFGQIMAEILVYKEDIWKERLQKMGMFLGKFIYLMDAYEDVWEDVEKGRYNLFSEQYQEPNFEKKIQDILLMMMAGCCREFEMLPILKHGELLRNILYAGVWTRFQMVKEKREREKE